MALLDFRGGSITTTGSCNMENERIVDITVLVADVALGGASFLL